MDQEKKPSVLFAYFTYTNQTKKVLDPIESFPLKKPYREMFGMIPAELREKPVQIAIPDAVTEREYDLVVVGAPTWSEWASSGIFN